MKSNCIFCDLKDEGIIAENEFAMAVRDKFPATKLHTLIIPIRHVVDYFDLQVDEVLACNTLLQIVKDDILERDPSVEGFNIGVNCGSAAGQTIFHCHIHIIPRRTGDVSNPCGGIRHVIGKGNYRSLKK